MADDIFAPLPGAGRAPKPAAPNDPWRAIIPVLDDAPSGPPHHSRHSNATRYWTYRDAAGELLGYVLRFDLAGGRKEFAPATYCENAATGAREWRFKAWPAPRPLYGLDRLPQRAGAPVMVCEGEKAADAAAELLPGHVAVTSPNGAKSAAKADWRALAGRDVTLWPDNDDEGRAYAEDVARLATAAGAASVAIVAVPADWPPGWDLADPLPHDAAPERLGELLQSATPWTLPAPEQPSGEGDDAAEIARLAALPLVAYGRERKPAAERLGCPVSILDRAVATERRNGGKVAGQGRPLDLPDPEPWPQPVDGAALLGGLAAAIRRHVVLSETEAAAAALWVVGTHAFDIWTIFPRLFISSPEKGCGKSTLLDVLSRLVPKPLGASGITTAALFRVIEAARPTLLLDEADTYARDNEDLRGVLDAGHWCGGAVIRTVGEDHDPRQFSAWAPVALAAIGHLPGTIEDRSVIIRLRRRRPDEGLEPLRLDRTNGIEKLASMAARWAADHATALAAADPAMPAGIINRTADNWRPLLAVADLAGGNWPEHVRRAAAELSAKSDDQGSIKVALLTDIRAAFAAKAVDRIASEDLAAYLGSLDDRPWSEYRGGKPITKAQVARLLKPFGVSSGTIRLPDGRTPKGYQLASFSDAFTRYLPQNATTPQPQDFRGFAADFKAPHENKRGVSEMRETPSVSAPCGVVAFPEPPPDDDNAILFEERAAIRQHDGVSRAPRLSGSRMLSLD